jgi:hypothetical protein
MDSRRFEERRWQGGTTWNMQTEGVSGLRELVGTRPRRAAERLSGRPGRRFQKNRRVWQAPAGRDCLRYTAPHQPLRDIFCKSFARVYFARYHCIWKLSCIRVPTMSYGGQTPTIVVLREGRPQAPHCLHRLRSF